MENNLEKKYWVKLTDNALELDPELVKAMGAVKGDSIDICYEDKSGMYRPHICKSSTGNKLTGKNTVSYRGKNNTALAELGTEFVVYHNDNGFFPMYGKNPKTKIFSNVTSAVQHLSKLDKATILDNNFILQNFDNYEF